MTQPETPAAVVPDDHPTPNDGQAGGSHDAAAQAQSTGLGGESQERTVSGWQRWARWVGLAILVVVSAYGIREFINGDAVAVTAYWSHRYTILPVVLIFAMMDVTVEMIAWMWVYTRFGMKAIDRVGLAVGLSGKAGLLLPAQLGRLVRPDEMVRLGRGTLPQCLKAEAVVFVLDSISVLALFAALVAYRVHGLLAPLAGAAVIGTALLMGNWLLKLLSGTKLELPRGFWWSWVTFLIVVVQSTGWMAHGVAFFILASDLPGNVSLWDALFLAPGSAVLGLGSGVPGGIGATEALLGASMGFKGVPQEHLAMGVAAFRIVTFWVLLPLGWLALAYVGRKARKLREAGTERAAPKPESRTPNPEGDAR